MVSMSKTIKNQAKTIKKQAKKRKTIKFSKLKRLCFCNSKKIPDFIEIGGRRKEWCGFGWIDLQNATGTETLVVD
jgi:hypothetical protein